MELTESAIFDALLRILPATLFTLLFGYLVVLIGKARLRPLPVWRYVALAVFVTAVWRWIVIVLGFTEWWPYLLATWVSPITQGMYVFLGTAIFALAATGSRSRSSD